VSFEPVADACAGPSVERRRLSCFQPVPLARLDSLDAFGQARVYLKIDGQGAGAAALEGAAGGARPGRRGRARASLVELYKGQELLPALYERLGSEGFALVWLGDAVFQDRDSDEILSLDAIFIRRRPALGERGSGRLEAGAADEAVEPDGDRETSPASVCADLVGGHGAEESLRPRLIPLKRWDAASIDHLAP
jgi:hypothetical protein